MTKPRVEAVKYGLYNIRCDIKILPYRTATTPPRRKFEFRSEIWALVKEEAYGLKVGDIIKGDGFICENDVIEDYFILVTSWGKVTD